MKRLAIVTTHPIQYYAPFFKILAVHPQLQIKVFYTWGEDSITKHDPGFNRTIKWDIPLLEGYNFEFLINTSQAPGSNRFNGIINSNAIERIAFFNPDIVLIYGWCYHSHLKIIRHFSRRVPVWFQGDSTILDSSDKLKDLLKNSVKSLLLRWVYSHISRALYVGSNNKDYFLKYGLKNEQLTFSPHAVDNTRFSTEKNESASLIRKQFGILESEILILFAGKFEEKKAPLLLLKAFQALNQPKTHLLFVGNGPLEKQLKTLATSNQSRVHFLGFQNQQAMPNIYHACNLFCLPSKGPGETWGLAINEAMACGKAILASNKVGCAKDLVQENVNGCVFEAENIQELLLKLRSLCDFEKLERFGCNSAELIKEWSFENKAANLIKEILNENKRQD